MKKIIFVLLTMLLLIVPLSANQTQRTKLSSDMRSMLAAMELIQKAGFYNDHVMMKTGVKNLKNGLESLRSSDAKKYLPKNQAYADKFAQKRAKMIDMYADDILSSLKDKNMDLSNVDKEDEVIY